jgi:hypothetical protein
MSTDPAVVELDGVEYISKADYDALNEKYNTRHAASGTGSGSRTSSKRGHLTFADYAIVLHPLNDFVFCYDHLLLGAALLCRNRGGRFGWFEPPPNLHGVSMR